MENHLVLGIMEATENRALLGARIIHQRQRLIGMGGRDDRIEHGALTARGHDFHAHRRAAQGGHASPTRVLKPAVATSFCT